MAQPVQHFFEPPLGGLGSSTLQCFCERLQMFTRRMKVERFDRCFEAILRQIPQLDRSVHNHVNNFGSSHPSALRLRMHSFAKVHGRSFRWRRHGKLCQQQPVKESVLDIGYSPPSFNSPAMIRSASAWSARRTRGRRPAHIDAVLEAVSSVADVFLRPHFQAGALFRRIRARQGFLCARGGGHAALEFITARVLVSTT